MEKAQDLEKRRIKTTAVGAVSISSESAINGTYDFASSIPQLSDGDWRALMSSGTKVRQVSQNVRYLIPADRKTFRWFSIAMRLLLKMAPRMRLYSGTEEREPSHHKR